MSFVVLFDKELRIDLHFLKVLFNFVYSKSEIKVVILIVLDES